MNRFINKTVLSKKDITEINTHIYLKTPLYITLYVVCILTLATQLVDFFTNRIINLSSTIPFLLALVAMLLVFVSNNRNMLSQRMDENGNPIEYNYTAENGVIRLETSNGKTSELELKMIYKFFETKNCFGIRGRDNSFYIIKKNGFSEGTAEDFSILLKKSK